MDKLQHKFRSEVEAIRAEGDRSKAKATDEAYRRGQKCLSRFDRDIMKSQTNATSGQIAFTRT